MTAIRSRAAASGCASSTRDLAWPYMRATRSSNLSCSIGQNSDLRAAGDSATPDVKVHVGSCVRLVPVEDDLAELLGEQQMSCRLWPAQTEGPYRRDIHL